MAAMDNVQSAIEPSARGSARGLPPQEELLALAESSAPTPPVEDPARDELRARFEDRLVVRHDLNRRLVSYQANKAMPGLRWLKYKEGFSAHLVQDALQLAEGMVLDPFAGLCTTPLVAGGANRPAIGIEIMPVGPRVARAVGALAQGAHTNSLAKGAKQLLGAVSGRHAEPDFSFPHVPITASAFPAETEDAISRARAHLAKLDAGPVRSVLDVACMSVLESVSFTRKDGQYLRWDPRSGRTLRGRGMDKGPMPDFADALAARLHEIRADIPALARCYGGRVPQIVEGSALRELGRLPEHSAGLTITSPPYANRYDYTRTYALELAWLGYDRAAFGALRQSLLSATVENRAKDDVLNEGFPHPELLAGARRLVSCQPALSEVLDRLEAKRAELSNPHVIRLVRNYVLEMSIIVAELARAARPGGRVVMVNDNVQYHGEEVPIDLILSDIAEEFGFECEQIGVLPRGKGNASQQMGRFGRREIRKCVYQWRKR